MEGSEIVRVQDLRKVYKSKRKPDVVAVDGVSFSVPEGQIVGLLGPNGAGKTTTIKSICTLLLPTSGQIHIGGIDAIASPRTAVEKMSAVLEGNRNIYWRLTPRENLELFAGLHGIAPKAVRGSIEELLERFRLTDKAKTEARALSRGMQQKLAVACAFVKQTPVLLLDEPTLGLDVETSHELRHHLRDLARDAGRTILLSSHDMDVVQEMCQRVIIIDHGRIVTDDEVSNLLALFKARSYRFVLNGPLAEPYRSRLLEEFPLTGLTSDAEHSYLEVELPEGNQIYTLMELLRAAGAEIEGIDRKEPDLEEIFLNVVRSSPVASAIPAPHVDGGGLQG